MTSGAGHLQDWIALAAELEPELAASPKDARRAILEAAATRWGRKPVTLRRMTRAYKYLVARAKGVGLGLEEVGAPVGCVEVLERMERNHPALEGGFRRAVLLGRFSFRELLEKEAELRAAAGARMRGDPVDWGAFAIEMSYDLFGHGKLSFAFGANRKGYSQTALNLRVDWEVEYEGERVAVYLSPAIVFSESRGGTVLDALPRAVMATFYYSRVIYIAWDEAERDLAEGYLAPAPRIAGLAFRIETFLDLPFGRANGSVYHA